MDLHLVMAPACTDALQADITSHPTIVDAQRATVWFYPPLLFWGDI